MSLEDFNEQISKAKEEGKKLGEESARRYIEEVIESETVEWSSVVESAGTLEERKEIIKAILSVSWIETLAKERQIWLDNEQNTHNATEVHPEFKDMIEKTLESIKEYHRMINAVRAKYKLPPKYTESE
jgi:hypothetical protein